MKYYLGLGSNLGARRENIESAVARLKLLLGLSSIRISPVYVTPALLPPLAPNDWNKLFLNVVIEFASEIAPEKLLEVTQQVERETGRAPTVKWAPRPLDIDILACDSRASGDFDLDQSIRVQSNNLTLPHPEAHKRAFVLDPLKDLNPTPKNVHAARANKQHAPLFMGILNITPDSFSDGGDWQTHLEEKIIDWASQNVNIIDVGGESTRPGAKVLTADEEWQRIAPVLERIHQHYNGRLVKPQISVDTRHYKTAFNAIERFAVDIINDVSGLADERFASLICKSDTQYILMHSLSAPADKNRVMRADIDVVSEVKTWFTQKIMRLEEMGVVKEKVILDPGIGFGKTSRQSQILLHNIDDFYGLGLRVLVGHSRKSFLSTISHVAAQDRDIESLGGSLALVEKGVDILRVHNPALHMRAFQGFNFLRNQQVNHEQDT